MIMLIFKNMPGPFSKHFGNRVCFQNKHEQIPAVRARRRPEGAAGGGTRAMFSKKMKTDPSFKYYGERPIHTFSKSAFSLFFTNNHHFRRDASSHSMWREICLCILTKLRSGIGSEQASS
jgi:hypothetical protein